MDQLLSFLTSYDPSEVEVHLKKEDGSTVKVHGFAQDTKVSFKKGAIYLHLQATSEIVNTLLKELGNTVKVNIATTGSLEEFVSFFDDLEGELVLEEAQVVSNDIPIVVFKIVP